MTVLLLFKTRDLELKMKARTFNEFNTESILKNIVLISDVDLCSNIRINWNSQ